MSENCGETCHLVATSSHGCNMTGVSLDAGKILTQNSFYIYMYIFMYIYIYNMCVCGSQTMHCRKIHLP